MLEFAEVSLDLDQAVPCGLILNELMTNALKYAFPDGNTGTIWVELCASPERVLNLRVADDGIGLPVDLDIPHARSLGLQLVNSLVAAGGWQLGSRTFRRDGFSGFVWILIGGGGLMPKSGVLIVEDERIVALDIQSSLENCGYLVAGQADRGEEAVQKAAELRPDLVLMDIGLKGEIEPIEAAETDSEAIGSAGNFSDTRLQTRPPWTATGWPNRLATFSSLLTRARLTSNIEMALYKHRLEHNLRESEERYRSLFETMAQGVVYLIGEGRIYLSNPAAGGYLGVTMGSDARPDVHRYALAGVARGWLRLSRERPTRLWLRCAAANR